MHVRLLKPTRLNLALFNSSPLCHADCIILILRALRLIMKILYSRTNPLSRDATRSAALSTDRRGRSATPWRRLLSDDASLANGAHLDVAGE